MKNIRINSINGGVNVTFTHDDDSTHTEIISGPNVPLNDAAELTQFLKDYVSAWEAGKAIEAHDLSAVNSLVDQTITLP